MKKRTTLDAENWVGLDTWPKIKNTRILDSIAREVISYWRNYTPIFLTNGKYFDENAKVLMNMAIYHYSALH